MGTTNKDEKTSTLSSASPCADLRNAYHNCFNRVYGLKLANETEFLRASSIQTSNLRWYSEKYVKGQCDKEECIDEWKKYKDCLSENLDGKLLIRILEVDKELNSRKQN